MDDNVVIDYDYVKSHGLLLPFKKKYTMRDFNKLHQKHDAMMARFIIICSAATYKSKISDIFWDTNKFLYMPDL